MDPEENVGGASVDVNDAAPASYDTIDAALNAPWDDDEDDLAAPAASDPSPDATPDAPAGDDGQDDGETTSSPNADDDAFEFDKVHGNTRFRFRDGTVMTKAEIAKQVGALKDFQREREAFEPVKREFEARSTQIAQQEQFFQSSIQQAIDIAKAYLPPPPDERLKDVDRLEYMLQRERWNDEVGKIRNLEARRQAHAEAAQKRSQQQLQQYLVEQQGKLLEAHKDLRDPKKASEFYSDLMSHGEKYGFSKEELGGVYDHRMLGLLRDAIGFRKLQASKAVVEQKARGAIPVQKPGRVATPAERQSRSGTNSLVQRAAQAGTLSAALQAYMELPD